MITITPNVLQRLQAIITEKNINNHALRVFVSGGGCSGLNYGMTFSELPEATDQIFETAGLKVIIDPAGYEYLMGGGFRIENPNTVQTCSCGSSFQTTAGEQGQSCSC